VAGGGPAGSTLAWKLASKGVKTIVLEGHSSLGKKYAAIM
jgi:flavin-dependent dehydrogenase